MVFDLGDPIPTSAEVLGKVAVVDRGTTTKCKYDQVMSIAREKTANAGGNGLAIVEHRSPSTWGSSCHQIEGMALRITDMTVDPSVPNVVEQIIEDNTIRNEIIVEKRRAPTNTLTISVGPGYVTSEIYTPDRTYKGKAGLEWKAEYNRIFKNGMGFGLQYSGFRANFEQDIYMSISYFAPSFIGRKKLGESWIIKYGVGMGLFLYNDSGFETHAGFGMDVNFGGEYMVSKSVGIGLEVQAISGSISRQEQLPDDVKSGIARINMQGGIRFYF